MGRSEVKAGSRKLLVPGIASDPYIIFTVATTTSESTKIDRPINNI
jgi:hypothetical protein